MHFQPLYQALSHFSVFIQKALIWSCVFLCNFEAHYFQVWPKKGQTLFWGSSVFVIVHFVRDWISTHALLLVLFFSLVLRFSCVSLLVSQCLWPVYLHIFTLGLFLCLWSLVPLKNPNPPKTVLFLFHAVLRCSRWKAHLIVPLQASSCVNMHGS